jgi:hypothetical protein
VTDQPVALSQPVQVGDLIVVGNFAVPSLTGYSVSDDGPGGGNTYGLDVLDFSPADAASCMLWHGLVGLAASSLLITVHHEPTSPADLIVVASHWRHAGPIQAGPVTSGFGHGTLLATAPLSVSHPQTLMVAFAGTLLFFDPAIPDPPLSPDVIVADDPSMGGTLASAVASLGLFANTMHRGFVGDWVEVAASFFVAAPPPPPGGPSTPFFHGGISPMPQR